MKEIWKDIKGYEGLYQVSNIGNVKSLWYGKERMLQQSPDTRGYLQVVLYKSSTRKTFKTHILVAKSFIDNPDKKLTVNHKDGIKINNKLYNLEWNTYLENIQHAIKNGLNNQRGESHSRAKLTEKQVLEIWRLHRTNKYIYQEIADLIGCKKNCINDILSGRSWKNVIPVINPEVIFDKDNAGLKIKVL